LWLATAGCELRWAVAADHFVLTGADAADEIQHEHCVAKMAHTSSGRPAALGTNAEADR
jgi:hypothetical protein